MIIDQATKTGTLRWVVELTAGYETNLKSNSERKENRHKDCVEHNGKDNRTSCLGLFGNLCVDFKNMLDELKLEQAYICK